MAPLAAAFRARRVPDGASHSVGHVSRIRSTCRRALGAPARRRARVRPGGPSRSGARARPPRARLSHRRPQGRTPRVTIRHRSAYRPRQIVLSARHGVS
eukprot:6698764-Prymnesium_polylepis.1